MALQHIPDDVIRFILLGIPSVPFLEALFLIRNDVEHAWDAKQLAQRLDLSEKAAAQLLRNLLDAGMLMVSEQNHSFYRYHPASQALRRMIDQLADSYTHSIVEVRHLIHSQFSKKGTSSR